MFDATGKEVVSSDPVKWHFDYSSGYLYINNKNNLPKPFSISGYIYVGSFGVGTNSDDGSGEPGSSGGSSSWRSPVPDHSNLPTINNKEGDVRLVLDENQLYVYENSVWAKIYNFSQAFKDPVASFSVLPVSGNTQGDLRLALLENSIYRWEESTQEWLDILNKHNHDDRYFTKQQSQDLVTAAVEAKQELNYDDLYYRKEQVDQKIRWRPSVASETDLPPYTENNDGDVILTRDTNTIWRYDFFSNPAAWKKVSSGLNTWKDPVATKSLLPTVENRIGDVRLVLDEKVQYFWDGTQWLPNAIAAHIHDDRYYTKTYIDNLNFNWKNPVATESLLPSALNNTGDVRMTVDTLAAYFWDSNKWVKWTASNRWRDPVDSIANLPVYNNSDTDLRYVRSENFIYIWSSQNSVWKPLAIPAHTHDDIYYTKQQLDNGHLDSRYYLKQEVDSRFDVSTGHNHDGVSSARIDYNNLLNLPYFYWKNPVVDDTQLPLSGNEPGDTRIILDSASCKAWDGTQWVLINEGQFALKDHDHNTIYYQKQQVDNLISAVLEEFNVELMKKADVNHTHDDRYYSKAVVDTLIQDRFDLVSGHNHNGINSRRISYYDLLDIPAANMSHDHNDLYYTKTELQTSNQSQVNWDNIINKPDLANSNWKSPVQTVLDLPRLNNSVGDIRLVLNDSDIYEWVGNQWVLLGRWDNKYVNYWKPPVNTYLDLPIALNVDGDVRLVTSENSLYTWVDRMKIWTAVVNVESDAQVYLNGDLLMGNGVEYARIRERQVQLKIPAKAGDKVTLILKYDYKTIRKDFVAYSGQVIFDFQIGYVREEFLALTSQTQFIRQHPYIKDGNALIVWLNGILQRLNIDYIEVDAFTFYFLQPLQDQDRVITISIDHASGDGQYAREDYDATTGQTDFVLMNAFLPGGGNLVVYLNGLLQRPNDDYKEINSSKIAFYKPCTAPDRITFLIFNIEAINAVPDADQINLGNAKDQNWGDGLLNFYSTYKVAYALDDLNEAMLEVAPTKPNYLQGLNLTIDGASLRSGYESVGSDSYESVPGSYRNYLINTGSFKLLTPLEDSFGDADQGSLDLYINGDRLDTFNLRNAFVELNRKSKQVSNSYGIKANGAFENEGATGTQGSLRDSINGLISVMSVQSYKNFSLFQIAQVRINLSPTLLHKGFNQIYLNHSTSSRSSSSSVFKFFYDNSTAVPELIADVGIEENNIISNKYLSGVRYYSLGDSFKTYFLAANLFNNTFLEIPSILGIDGANDFEVEYNSSDIEGVSVNPKIGEIADYHGVITLNKFNEMNVDSKLSVVLHTVFSTSNLFYSSSVNRLINTYSNVSSDRIELFLDESYRLPTSDYDVVPTVRKGVWNSRSALTLDSAMIFNSRLMYANNNFSSYKPVQVVDYSSFTGQQNYFRSFINISPKNNNTFVIRGVTEDNIRKNHIFIDLKLPGETGWLSMNKDYDIASFSGVDGDGCLLSVNGENFSCSTGFKSTARSGNVTIMRIRISATSPNVTYIELL